MTPRPKKAAPTVSPLLKSLNKLHEECDVVLDTYNTISTGSLVLDWAVGCGGIPPGTLVDVYGPEAIGKTTLVLSVMGERTKFNNHCAFLDVEHRINPDLVRTVIPNMDCFHLYRPKDGDIAYNTLRKLITEPEFKEVKIIGLDSIAAIVPAKMLEEDFNPSQPAVVARATSHLLRTVMAKLRENGKVVFFVNQMRQRISLLSGTREEPTGGNAIKYYASLRMRMRPAGKIVERDTLIGQNIDIEIEKNSWAAPGKKVGLSILYGRGFDRQRDLIEGGTMTGVIRQETGWYTYEGVNENNEPVVIKGHGKSDLIEKLTPIMPQVYTQIRKSLVNKDSVLPPVSEEGLADAQSQQQDEQS